MVATKTPTPRAARRKARPDAERTNGARPGRADLPGQVVLVLQGGGALGAYQVGVYQALHECGIEPDWVIGTSIGAINAALISGNRPEDRLDRLDAFWAGVEQKITSNGWLEAFGMQNLVTNWFTVARGIPGFFTPNLAVLDGLHGAVGIEEAAYYSTAPLRDTLRALVDFDYLCACRTRMTVGAVNACSGRMHYFDSRDEPVGIDHVMASGALPPAFPAVRIDGEPYWDGGLYSNTPIEAVLDDKPRRDALIFAVNVWHQTAPEPMSIRDVSSRIKDIQYASRADSHIARQKQIHRLRHVIRCGTTMHVAHLLAPRVAGEDQTKDIDFTSGGIRARRDSGYADTVRMIRRAPWREPADPIEGVIEHV